MESNSSRPTPLPRTGSSTITSNTTALKTPSVWARANATSRPVARSHSPNTTSEPATTARVCSTVRPRVHHTPWKRRCRSPSWASVRRSIRSRSTLGPPRLRSGLDLAARLRLLHLEHGRRHRTTGERRRPVCPQVYPRPAADEGVYGRQSGPDGRVECPAGGAAAGDRGGRDRETDGQPVERIPRRLGRR